MGDNTDNVYCHLSLLFRILLLNRRYRLVDRRLGRLDYRRRWGRQTLSIE
ncbi:hypothetical protein L7E55_00045 [Pelotomaculum isophthalicicum JI]|uniref:Uncharacterized protein n=1 Tax=Pelotomaculum isophthalicicum JI TaxID=947010 RepID=A0A9X4JUQ4_9FIRM|nr:hypothetical protein [Pelotomaculum isophthalicicum]MDF9406761.1 hypothetical protein [Pelotomaculum isophthalicicum JI]